MSYPTYDACRLACPGMMIRANTDTELAAISHLAYSGTGDATAQVLLLKIATSDGIDLDSANVAAGLEYLVGKGVLGASRKAEILS